MKQIRSLMSLVLSLTLITSSVPAHPQSGDLRAQVDAAQEYNEKFADLNKFGEGLPKSSIAADRFLLMDQTVMPKTIPVVRTLVGHKFREWRLKSLMKRTNRLIRLAKKYPNSVAVTPPVLTGEQIEELAIKHVTVGRRVDTPEFIWDRRHSVEQLEEISRNLQFMLYRWRYVNEGNRTQAPVETRVRTATWWNMNLVVSENERDTFVSELSAGGGAYKCAKAGDCSFKLAKGSTTYHIFGLPIQSIAHVGPYVVFTHADAYDAATGTQYLLFLDLDSYQGNLGNDEIPVFRLPLKIDQPLQSMAVRNGRLMINDKWSVERGYFKQASEMQKIAFNLTANMVNAESWAQVLPVVDSVQEYFSKFVREELDSAVDEKKGVGRAAVLMKELGQQIKTDLQKQAAVKPPTAKEKAELEKISKNLEATDEMKSSLLTYHAGVQQSDALEKVISKTQARVKATRKLAARVRLLGVSLLSPRPAASQKIKNAIGAWFVRGGVENTSRGWMDRILRLTDRPFVTAGVLGAGVMAAAAPGSFHNLVHMGLGFGTAMLDYMVFALRGVGEASVDGTKYTFAPFADVFNGSIGSIYKQYWEGDRWYKSLIGIPVFAAFIYSLYFVPHFIFNIAAARKDMREHNFKSFAERQSVFKRQYYEKLAQAEMDSRHHEQVTEFSPEEEERIMAWVDARKKSRGLLSFVGNKAEKDEVVDLIDAAAETSKEEVKTLIKAADESPAVLKAEDTEDFKGFWAAARHLAFSMPALELTLGKWARIWNAWASWRFSAMGFMYLNVGESRVPVGIKVKPVALAARTLYPEFMNTVVTRRTGKRILPTDLNGGFKTRGEFSKEKIHGLHSEPGPISKNDVFLHKGGAAAEEESASTGASSAEGKPASKWSRLKSWIMPWRKDVEEQDNTVSPKQQLQALLQFEDQIIDVEQKVMEVALRSSLSALAKYVTNEKDLEILFGSDVINSITSRNVQRMTWRSRTFLRAHFESVYNSAMEKYLSEMVGQGEREEVRANINLHVQEVVSERGSEVDADQARETSPGLVALKDTLIQMHANQGDSARFGFDLRSAQAAAMAVAKDPVHFEVAKQAVQRTRFAPSNIIKSTKYNLVTDFDPEQNKSMARYAQVDKRLKSATALGRAVRAEISKLLVTFPVNLGFKLLLTSAIFEGALAPIQPYLWGPNSTFYLSHTSFYGFFGAGFFMGMMADAWMKLQQDARQDEMGEFGQIPRGEDAERGFFRWYMKQFNAKENSLMKNWAYSNSLSFWNLPAALINISLFQFMFMGRVDLSLLAAGYVMAFTTPLSGFQNKIDQAFERAVHYAARGVEDEKWLAHPKVQEVVVPEMQKLRNRFTLFNDIKGDFEGNLIGNIEMIPTSLGPRGYMRAIFGGGLLEEYIVNYVFDPLQKATNGTLIGKVISPVISSCQWFLTNGNVDLNLSNTGTGTGGAPVPGASEAKEGLIQRILRSRYRVK